MLQHTTRLLATRIGTAAILTVLILMPAGIPASAVGIGRTTSGEIDRYLEAQLKATHIPGIGVAVVEGQQTTYLKGFGLASLATKKPVTPHTIFDLASCSKSFTALAVLLLENEGMIDLDAPLVRYLPEFRLTEPAVSSQITVRQLLDQTSGIPGTFAEPLAFHNGPDAMQKLVDSMARIQLDRPPGSSFEYSNLNYALLGALIEHVSGQQFEDYMQERVFQPLGMADSTFRPNIAASRDRADGHQLLLGRVVTRNVPVYRSMLPAGWAMSSAEDMGRWVIANLNSGVIDGKQVIPPQLVSLMHATACTFVKDGEEAGYGMGWFTGKLADGTPVLWHGGDTPNFLSEMILLPEQRVGIVMLANGQTTPNAHQIAINIAAMVTGKHIELPAAPWWASWKSIDNISIYATILAFVLVLGLVPYCWWQTHVIRRVREKPNTATRGRRLRLWWVVVPATPWVFFALLASGAYAVFETIFGFNVFRTIVRFGYFAPPGVIVAAVATVVALFLWAMALSVTAIFRAVARAR